LNSSGAKILVTGANGFIGKALCNELENRGLPYNTLSYKDISYHQLHADIEVVIHLAGRAHVTRETHQDTVQAYYESNVLATVNLARHAAKAGIKRFLYVSSIKVNGEETEAEKPFRESDVPVPADDYGKSKLEAEQMLLKIAIETGMEVVILRPPLVYGAGVKANFLSLIRWVNSGWPLPLGAINNRRSMVYVGNLIDALLACAYHPEARGQVFLISDDESVSTAGLAKALASALHRSIMMLNVPKAILKFLGGLIGKNAAIDRLTQSLVIDNSKIKRLLGWHPPYTFEDGIKATVAWYSSMKNVSR
jgi:nucleoside-diphosphate-sugar epimerase